MVLLIDNYDSFVYNLARYIGQLGYERKVVRNDTISIAEILKLNPSHIVLSPGPCSPNEAGISLEVCHKLSGKIPILGICLGHQSIGQAFGARIVLAKRPMHGMSSFIHNNGVGIFERLPLRFQVARYHSLIVESSTIPDELMITASSSEGEIMALQHRKYLVYGLQFHPESVLTEHGYQLLYNFIMLGIQNKNTNIKGNYTPLHSPGRQLRDDLP